MGFGLGLEEAGRGSGRCGGATGSLPAAAMAAAGIDPAAAAADPPSCSACCVSELCGMWLVRGWIGGLLNALGQGRVELAYGLSDA